MADLSVTDVRPFVAAKDFATSRAFYAVLGWTELWSDDGLALLELGDSRIMLQDFYVREWAENSVLIVEVVDAAAWHAHITAALETGAFGDARVSGPKEEDWGATVTYAWDPAGLLLQFIQWTNR